MPKVMAGVVAWLALRLLAAAHVDLGVAGVSPATAEGLITLTVMYLWPASREPVDVAGGRLE